MLRHLETTGRREEPLLRRLVLRPDELNSSLESIQAMAPSRFMLHVEMRQSVAVANAT